MTLVINIFFVLYLFNLFKEGEVAVDFHLAKNFHQPRELPENEIIEIAQLSDMNRFKSILSNILVPRIVTSENHRKVREYIMKELKGLDYKIETHNFKDETPYGKLDFINIIARLNPDANRFLTLACHYDSKNMSEGEFWAATDSAVPCAMMVDLAHALKEKLEPFKKTDLSLMMVFFDGEEAFVNWTEKDSLYGARALAAHWDGKNYPRHDSDTNELSRIDLMMLLDLLGGPEPQFYSFIPYTNTWYLQLVSIENALKKTGHLNGSRRHNQYFNKKALKVNVEDDHIPFLHRGTPILHIIPYPFPSVWHTLGDNLTAVDFPTVDNLNKIFRVFTMEYLTAISTILQPGKMLILLCLNFAWKRLMNSL